MPIEATIIGSWFRTPEIMGFFQQSQTGEILLEHEGVIETAGRGAIRNQVNPRGAGLGLNWVSNGEKRKTGYAYYLQNRFDGVSKTERLGDIDEIHPDDILGGGDCGFETFADFGNVPHAVDPQKRGALTEGAALASRELGLK